MMKRTLALAAVLLVLGAVPAAAQLTRFTGNWVNVNSGTSGIVRLRIAAAGTAVTVRAFGACTPTPCDWGTQPGIAYGPSVGSNPVGTARAVTVRFQTGFSETILVLRPVGTNRLEVFRFTRFTDSSGRFPFTATEVVQRS